MSQTRRITDLQLEQLALGELPDAEAALLRARIAADPEAAARLERLEASNREVLAQYPPGPQVGAIRRKLAGERSVRARRAPLVAVSALATAAAVVLVLVLIRPPDSPIRVGGDLGPVPSRHGVRLKGPARLVLHRQGDPVPLGPGATVRRGERLQVAYEAEGDARFGVILSQDGRGQVTLHFPVTDRGDTRLAQGRRQTLGSSYELDDAPGFERFLFVVSRRPIDVSAVVRSVKALGTDGTARPDLPGETVLRMDIAFRKPSRR